MESRRNMWLNVMGRLKPGVARASAPRPRSTSSGSRFCKMS